MFTGWPTLTQTYWSVFYRCSHDSLRLFKHIDLFSIGVHTIAYAYPNVKIITAAVDHEVNDKYHIIPGIGKLSGYFWLPRNPLLRSIFISWVCSHGLFINWWKCSPFSITFPLFFHLFETKESIAWCFLVDRNIFLRNTGITGFEKFTIYTQPRPQGFSLKKWVGKAVGTRLHLHYVTDVRSHNLRSASDVSETSLFWAPNWLNQSWELRFEFPFNLIGDSTMAFLTGQSWRVLKSWYTGGDPEQKDFGSILGVLK